MVTTLLSNNTLLIIRLGSNRICTSLRVKVPFCPYFARSKFPEFQNLFASHICSPAKENLYGAIWKMSSDKAHNSSHYSTKRYKYHRGTVNVTEKYPESEEQSEERRGNEVRKDKTSSRKCKAQVEDVSLTSNCSSTTTHAFEDVKRASVPRSLEQKPRKRKQKLWCSSNSPIEENHLERPCSSGSHRSTKKWRKLEKSAPVSVPSVADVTKHEILDAAFNNIFNNVVSAEEVVNSSRHWLQLKPLPPPGTPGMEFSLMSYNILAQSLLEMHDYLYSHCKHRDLLWPRRGSSILRQIITHNADIVCLQEVQADHWKHDIRPVLNSYGYYGVFKKRVGDKPDGCAILYKLDKFRHIKFVPVQFQQGGILDRDNIGIILLLQPKDNFSGRKAKTLCVATTHLLFNPRRGDVKLAQLIMFLAEIDKVAAIGPEDEMGRGLLKKKKRRDRVRRDNEKTKLECNYQSGKGAGESESMSHQSCHPQVDEESLKEGEIKEEKESFRVTIYKCKEKDREVREGTSRSEFSQHNESRESEFSINQYDTQAHAENIEEDENEENKESSLSTNYCPIILCGDFNSEPFCDLYKFVTSGHLRYEGLISRLICGQSEGRERGFNDYLGPYLLPSNLSISESCQYTRVIMERQKRLLQNRRSDRSSGNREKDSHSRSHFNKREEMGPKGSHMNDKDEGDSRKHRHEHPTSSSKIATREGERVVENDLDKSSLHTRGVRDGNDVEKINNRSSHDMDKEKESEEPIQLPGCNTGQAYHRMNFRSVYSHLTDKQGPDGEYVKEVSSQHDKCSCTVDYIFYSSFPTQNHNRCGALNNKNDGDSEISSKMVSNEANKDCALETATFNDMDIVENRDKTPEPEQEQQLELLARYSLLTADQTADSGHLPNAIFPSDHLCLISKFFLR